MESDEKLAALLELAQRAGLEVRSVGLRSAPAGEPPPSSAVCRVRDAVWIVLSAADPPEAQVRVLASALREHAADFLDQHFVPPALRELL